METTRHRRLRFAGVALLLVLPARAEAVLQLSEILSGPQTDWNGDGVVHSRDDEWIELRNPGPGPEILDGVYLRDGTGDAYHFGFSGTLLPGEVLLVTGADAVAWGSTSGLSLNNSGDTLQLLRDQGTVEILDEVSVPAHAATADRSLARAPDDATWILYDALAPYSGTLDPLGTGCAPSPGIANTCRSTVATRPLSVGGLKARFGPAPR